MGSDEAGEGDHDDSGKLHDESVELFVSVMKKKILWWMSDVKENCKRV